MKDFVEVGGQFMQTVVWINDPKRKRKMKYICRLCPSVRFTTFDEWFQHHQWFHFFESDVAPTPVIEKEGQDEG